MSRFHGTVTNEYGLNILDSHSTYADFIAEHPTGEVGDVHLVGTNLYVWHAEENEWFDAGVIVGEEGPQGVQGPQGDTGPTPFTIIGAYNNGADYTYGDAVYYSGGTYVRTGNPNNPGYAPTPGSINASWTPIADKGDAGDPLDFLSVPSNIVPTTTNTYTLGTSTKRWADIYIGPNTINITDTVTGDNAALTVTNGVLLIDGANQLQVGQLKFVNNTIESTTSSINIQIGLTSSTGNLTINRNTVIDPAKTLAVKKIIGTSTSQTIEIGSTSDTSTIELNRDTHIPTGKKLTFGTGRRVDVEASLAPYGKQTVCVKTVNGKNEMYWGSGASQGITGGTDYYILATFTTT